MSIHDWGTNSLNDQRAFDLLEILEEQVKWLSNASSNLHQIGQRVKGMCCPEHGNHSQLRKQMFVLVELFDSGLLEAFGSLLNFI